MTTMTEAAIRPFQFHASDEALADLRRRIAATNWPEREPVTDASQGVQLATMRKLARYWETDHDRRMAAIGGRLPRSRWLYRHLRNCSAFTPTCLRLYRPTLPRRSSSANRLRQASQPTRKARGTSSTSSTSTASATPRRWGTARRRC